MKTASFSKGVPLEEECPPAVFRHPSGRTLIAFIAGGGSIDDGILCAQASLRGLGHRWMAACDGKGEQAGSSALIRRLLTEAIGEAQRDFSARGAMDIQSPVAAIDIGPRRSVACVGGAACVLLVRAQKVVCGLAPRIAAEHAIAEGMSVVRAYQMPYAAYPYIRVNCLPEGTRDPFNCGEGWIVRRGDIILLGDYRLWHGARYASGYADEAVPSDLPDSIIESLLSDVPVAPHFDGACGIVVFPS